MVINPNKIHMDIRIYVMVFRNKIEEYTFQFKNN